METRPKMKPALSPLDKLVELTGKILLVVMWGLTVYAFVKLPGIIPTHFNAAGQANAHGSKNTMLVLPIIATIIYIGLTLLNSYPHIFNYAVEINENNAERQYMIATRLLRFMKVIILFLFSLIVFFIYLEATGVTSGLGIWFLPFTIALVLVPVIVSISQSLKKK